MIPYPEHLITRLPEAPRKRTLTVCPKARRRCIVSALARAEYRMASHVIGLARLDRQGAN